MIPFPKKKYSVIYADPPWSYAAGGGIVDEIQDMKKVLAEVAK